MVVEGGRKATIAGIAALEHLAIFCHPLVELLGIDGDFFNAETVAAEEKEGDRVGNVLDICEENGL